MIYTNKDLGDLMEQADNNQPFTYEEFLDFLYIKTAGEWDIVYPPHLKNGGVYRLSKYRGK